ncbi:unnamed protein product [Prorocentrum cordatum]|uniref:Uncharacterized protein n=1 Tax=Prorocentrum cordatum TaxID=2364126 RepID=A0ABN9TV13_9DINO|nr:unnamed protein product [Polarella glacialis]
MSAQAALGKISGRGSGTAGSGARSEHEAPVRERHGTGLRWQQEGAAGGESRPPRRANLSSARPQAVQVGCLVLFVGGVAAALGGELRGRPRLADGAPGASDAEHAALRRVVEESKMQARAGMRAHLQEFLGGHPQARYEEWIADFHPDNVVPPGRDSRGLPSIDRRHYHERSDHRMIWNEHVGDQRRHVSQFSLWLAEEAERAAARAELGWAWPADDEPAPEAEMEVRAGHDRRCDAPRLVRAVKSLRRDLLVGFRPRGALAGPWDREGTIQDEKLALGNGSGLPRTPR